MKQQSFLASTVLLINFLCSLDARLGIQAYGRALVHGHSEVSRLDKTVTYQWYSKPTCAMAKQAAEGQTVVEATAHFYEGHPYRYSNGERKQLYQFVQNLRLLKGMLISPCVSHFYKISRCTTPNKRTTRRELLLKLVQNSGTAFLLAYALTPNSNPDKETHNALASDLTENECENLGTSKKNYQALQAAFVKITKSKKIIYDTKNDRPQEDGSPEGNKRRYKAFASRLKTHPESVVHDTTNRSPWADIPQLQKANQWIN